MTRCPSQDWDRYCADNDLPEQCPVCNKDNADPNTGEWLSDPGFCSKECSEKYQEEQRISDEAAFKAREEADRLASEYWDYLWEIESDKS